MEIGNIFKCLKCNERCYQVENMNDVLVCGACRLVYDIEQADTEKISEMMAMEVSELEVRDKNGLLRK